MNAVDALEAKSQNLVNEANEHMTPQIDVALSKIAVAINDIRCNDCGCGEMMRIQAVENMMKKVENLFKT